MQQENDTLSAITIELCIVREHKQHWKAYWQQQHAATATHQPHLLLLRHAARCLVTTSTGPTVRIEMETLYVSCLELVALVVLALAFS